MALTIDTHHHMLPGFFFEATNEKENPVGGLKPQVWTPETFTWVQIQNHKSNWQKI
jgi:hypothetical protein